MLKLCVRQPRGRPYVYLTLMMAVDLEVRIKAQISNLRSIQSKDHRLAIRVRMLHRPVTVGAWQVSAAAVLAVAEPEIWVCKPIWGLSKGISVGDYLRRLFATCLLRVCGAMVARLTSIVFRYQKVAVSNTVTLIFFSSSYCLQRLYLSKSFKDWGRPSNLSPAFLPGFTRLLLSISIVVDAWPQRIN